MQRTLAPPSAVDLQGIDFDSPATFPDSFKGSFIETGRLRVKCGRLQRAYEYRPWVLGPSDSTRVQWRYVPVVSDDAPDDEERIDERN